MKLYLEKYIVTPASQVLVDTDPEPEGFTESTDIEDWEYYGTQAIDIDTVGFRDRKALRSVLKALVYTKMGVAVPADVDDPLKWALLTDKEKYIAAHYFLVGAEAFQLEVVNDDKYWTIQAYEYRIWTMEVRKIRLSLLEAIVFRRIADVSDAKKVMEDMNQIVEGTAIPTDVNDKTTAKVNIKKLNQQYINGIEGTVTDGSEHLGISDYIDSKAGTPFDAKGFRDLTYTFRGSHTATTVADELLKVIDGTW